MTTIELMSVPVVGRLRALLGSRRGLLILAAGAPGVGLATQWHWLVAAGIAPLLVSALPCVAMCALGLCMGKMAGGTPGPQTPPEDKTSDTSLLVGPSEPSAAAELPNRAQPRSAKSCCH